MNKAVIIVGMHRSGTSLTASILQECGLDIGKELMLEGEGNVKGHFENMDFYRFHMDLLIKHGHHPDGWVNRKINVKHKFLKGGQNLIDRNESSAWGWKDPRTTLFLDFWQTLLPNAKYLMVYRKPWEVVDSMNRRNTDKVLKQDTEMPIKAWMHYNKLMIEHFDKHQRDSILIDIDTLIHNTSAVITQINTQLGFALKVQESKVFEPTIFTKEASIDDEHVEVFLTNYPESNKLLRQLQQRAWPNAFIVNPSFAQRLAAFFKRNRSILNISSTCRFCCQ